MIFVDSSVWIQALRDADCPEAQHLRDLLDADRVAMAAPVRLEILGGASKRDRRRLRTLLEALPLYLPDAATWNRLDSWVERAGDADQQFGVGDLLVAAIVADHEGELWANDSDFARMEKLGFVRRHTPPAVS